MSGHDLDGAASQVIIISYENAAAHVRLYDCRFLGDYETTFAVELHADGLDARIGEVSVTPWDSGSLTDFMDGLAAESADGMAPGPGLSATSSSPRPSIPAVTSSSAGRSAPG